MKKIQCPQCGGENTGHTGESLIDYENASAEFWCADCDIMFWAVYKIDFLTMKDADGVCRSVIELKKN